MISQPGPRSAAEGREPPDIPVTVIGGYLGSGKTTLVNHLLRAGTERVAVLVNDFGDVDIDTSLIEHDDGETITLANGCICCSLVDGLAAALATVTALDPRPERLVIEASGVADPATVAAYGHGPGLVLDAVVVLVDAETIRRRATDRYVGDTVRGQLPSADIVVVNKVDLVDRAEVDAVVALVEERVRGALVVEAIEARVDPAVLFGRVARRGDAGPATAMGGDRPPIHDRADEVYQAWTWTAGDRSPIDRVVVEAVMAELPEAVVRAKGVLWLAGDGEAEARPHVLQRVGSRWTLRPARSAVGDGEEGSRLVLIGIRGAVDDQWLARRLA